MKHKVNPLRHHIDFETDDILHISIETERLIIRSIIAEDEKDCVGLLGDPLVMKKFATGVPYEEKTAKARLETWKNRWKDHDPFSVYAILEKKSKEFIGIIAIGHSAPGESEASYAIHQKFWGKAWRYSFGLFAKSLRNEYQNFFTYRDLKLNQKKYFQTINEDVDITAEEMANSPFGQQSYMARRSK